MNIIDDLEKRGLLDNFSDEEKVKKLFDTPQTVYCGFDPSAKSLQLGNFIMITILQRLQKAGHRVIAMLGGATGMIGDPSGKKAERKFLSPDQVMDNAECIRNQLAKYIDTSDPNKGLILNNYEWWSKTNILTFLRDYGKNFQVGYMLAKDIVKSRLEAGISYAEFSYMILQAGDFDNLFRDYHCTMQFGGGDQWGNLTTALDFVKKKEGSDCGAEVFSFKLITDSQGKKFGKSESGALYLDPTMTTPYHIYQYFMNVSDSDVLKYLYIFDDRPIEEGCGCPACRRYSRAYIRHLLKAKEMLGMRLCVLHNLYFYNTMMEEIRDALDEDRFESYKRAKLEGFAKNDKK